METINITRHAEKRASQRGITMEQISTATDRLEYRKFRQKHRRSCKLDSKILEGLI